MKVWLNALPVFAKSLLILIHGSEFGIRNAPREIFTFTSLQKSGVAQNFGDARSWLRMVGRGWSSSRLPGESPATLQRELDKHFGAVAEPVTLGQPDPN